MPITRADQANQLAPGIHTLFGDKYKQYEKQFARIFEVVKTGRAYEEEVKLAGFGAATAKTEGGVVTWATSGEAWKTRYVVQTYAHAFSITEEAFEDNLYVPVSTRYTKMLVRSMAYAKEVVHAAVFNNGFTNSAPYLGGDGVCLFSTSHPLYSGGTVSNRPATGVDLNEASLEAAYIAIKGWVDERGLLIMAKPKTVIYHPNDTFNITRILRSNLRVATSDNDANALKELNIFPGGSFCYDYLTDTNAWFIQTDVPDGIKSFQRIPVSTNVGGDFNTGNLLVRARERYAAGWSDYLNLYGSPGSS